MSAHAMDLAEVLILLAGALLVIVILLAGL